MRIVNVRGGVPTIDGDVVKRLNTDRKIHSSDGANFYETQNNGFLPSPETPLLLTFPYNYPDGNFYFNNTICIDYYFSNFTLLRLILPTTLIAYL